MNSKFIYLVCFYLLIAMSGVMAGEGGINTDLIQKWEKEPLQGLNKAICDAVASNSINDIALNRERWIKHNNLVNVELKAGSITDQKSSGRCWMFAGFNTLRPAVMEKFNLKDFEFSENYLMFYDKLEKTNDLFQYMIDFADRPLDDRELQIILEGDIGDGGWWSYFSGLLNKYGIVPQGVMPETHSSSSPGTMNKHLTLKAKEYGFELRNMKRAGKSDKEIEARKQEMLGDIYKILVLHLGQPPQKFVWRYKTDDSLGIVTYPDTLTPKAFLDKVLDIKLNDMVAIFNYPGKDYYENYVLSLSRNIYDDSDFTILNLPIDSMINFSLASILDSTPVWFACDVGQDNYRKDGVMAADIYNYEQIYGMPFGMPKGEMIALGLVTPNHAMTLVGVDTLDSKPFKWLVENSWGDKNGDKGNWYMYDDWFRKYTLGVVINKKYLPESVRRMLGKKPIILKPWDPMYRLKNLD